MQHNVCAANRSAYSSPAPPPLPDHSGILYKHSRSASPASSVTQAFVTRLVKHTKIVDDDEQRDEAADVKSAVRHFVNGIKQLMWTMIYKPKMDTIATAKDLI
jgi:hypothetical protein